LPSEFNAFKELINIDSEPYNWMFYDGVVIRPLLLDWNHVKSSNYDTKILDKVMKIYDEGMKLSKCLMHYDLKQIKERVSKFSNDKIRQNITNVLNQIEKLLDQVNYDMDKETTIKNGRQFLRIIKGFPRKFSLGKGREVFNSMNSNMIPYILYSYKHNFYAKGKKPTDLDEINKKMNEP